MDRVRAEIRGKPATASQSLGIAPSGVSSG
jgi:hypothetical protein